MDFCWWGGVGVGLPLGGESNEGCGGGVREGWWWYMVGGKIYD